MQSHVTAPWQNKCNYRWQGTHARTPVQSPGRSVNSATARTSALGGRAATGGLADLAEVLNIDRKTENERQYRRHIFSLDRWAEHRSTNRHWRHFLGMLNSRTYAALLPNVSALTLLSIMACLVETYFPVAAEKFPFEITDTPLSITSFALSLLLVFRTDASYARWQEALDAWGQVRSISLELVRYGLQCICDKQLQQVLARWTMAYSVSLKVHLREDADIGDELTGILLPHEVEAVRAADSHQHFILQSLSYIVESAHLSNLREERLFQHIMAFNDTIGVCDRILRHPIPLAYTRHTSRFLIIGLAAMPFALWNSCGWAVIPTEVFISFMLLGIEEIGVQVEEPFGVLPLDEICQDIEKEVGSMLASQQLINDTLRISLQGVNSTGGTNVRDALLGDQLRKLGANGNGSSVGVTGRVIVNDWHL